ncbi:hypothetical protein COO60DRAFT_447975 [Scenedesmus sp. NREL 46B-D3]|nr:hypothetical protein COO60DRAFT_447975 [Scenedesmus sp. NREL 46B-D3]
MYDACPHFCCGTFVFLPHLAAIYHDLMSKGDGTGEGLVSAYYQTVGWPTFLPTAEQAVFAGKVHQLKQKEMREMLQLGLLPLRDGILQVMTEAQTAGASIIVIAGTASEPDDDVASCLLKQLPADLAAAVRVYSSPAHSRPDEGEAAGAAAGDAGAQGQLGRGSSAGSLEASMAAAATRVKQQGAQEFVQRMATALEGKQAGVQVGLDMSLLQAGGPKPAASAAWLAAVAATLGVPAASCVAVGSSSSLINAAAAAGIPAVAVPRKMAYAASYPAAAAKFESFGPGYATWQKLCGVWRQQQQQQQRRRQ